MNKNTLIQLRDEDFTDCLRTTLRRLRDERRYLSAEHIIAEALASRPRRYYLSYATIASRLPKLRKSGQLNVAEGKRVNRAVGQWADINSAVDISAATNGPKSPKPSHTWSTSSVRAAFSSPIKGLASCCTAWSARPTALLFDPISNLTIHSIRNYEYHTQNN